MRLVSVSPLLVPIFALFACQKPVPPVESAKPPAEAAPASNPESLHERLLTLDTHVDFDPKYFTPDRHQGMELPTQVDLPKMKQGGLDAAFYIVYVGQGDLDDAGYAKAHEKAMEKFNAIHRMTAELNPDMIELATTAAAVRDIDRRGKKVALIGVENAYPIGKDLSRLQKFHELGARYISVTHNGHNQFGDSNTNNDKGPEELYGGLSDLGRELVAELNRLGVMVDISHASKKTALETIALSKAPVIASHSAIRALRDHTRNVGDEELDALKANGGVVQVVAFRSYLKEPPGELETFRAELNERFDIAGWHEWDKLTEEQKDEYRVEYRAAVSRLFPVTVSDFVDHIDYAVKRIGIDHVGISSDFGGGGGIDGWANAAETANVTAELLARGYSEEQLAKLWSGNLLRVMAAAAEAATPKSARR